MSEIYVKITGLCKRVTHFPQACFNPSSLLVKPYVKPYAQDGQNGKPEQEEGVLPYTVVFQFPNKAIYEQEQMSSCLSHCVPLFQAMLPAGWVYDDDDDESDMWVDGIVQENVAKTEGYVPFKRSI